MKRLTMKLKYFTPFALVALLSACGGSTDTAPADQAGSDPAVMTDGGQSTVVDDESEKNVVQVAIASPDHTTLVAAVKAADLVNALSNAGPFTVFAPTNEAFAALPAGTVDGLLKPDQKDALADILQYHVALGVFKPENIRDGQKQGDRKSVV